MSRFVFNDVAVLCLEEGPLCPSLLPAALRCFAQYFDVTLLGVEQRPSLAMALDILIKRKKQLLTVQSASHLFAYLNKLNGLNRSLVDRMSQTAFIPLPGSSFVHNERERERRAARSIPFRKRCSRQAIASVHSRQRLFQFVVAVGVGHEEGRRRRQQRDDERSGHAGSH